MLACHNLIEPKCENPYFQSCAQVCGECFDDFLYLLFQMFSGDELHIICEKVFVEKVK